jgi:hypothetical protein
MNAAQVEGGSPEDFVKLRTAAYHSMTAPSRFDEDVRSRRAALRVLLRRALASQGSYLGFDGKVRCSLPLARLWTRSQTNYAPLAHCPVPITGRCTRFRPARSTSTPT